MDKICNTQACVMPLHISLSKTPSNSQCRIGLCLKMPPFYSQSSVWWYILFQNVAQKKKIAVFLSRQRPCIADAPTCSLAVNSVVGHHICLYVLSHLTFYFKERFSQSAQLNYLYTNHDFFKVLWWLQTEYITQSFASTMKERKS